jgi:tetratricopeptide (TPR) repeat protein
MRRNMATKGCLMRLVFTLLCVLFASAATAGTDDPVLGGYRKAYNGDLDAAQQEFERLLAANPGDLPARFGLLYVLERRTRENRTEGPGFERQLDAFIADAEKRHDRGDHDSEALFYLASAYMLRAQYRYNNDKGIWAAARDGARSKKLSDAYIRRHPEHGDAYLALGTYNYYVELAPAFVKVLRLLMFLPSGDRGEGLKQIERAYMQGSLFAPQAGLLLIEIYGTYESRPADGVRVGQQLVRKFPDNPAYDFTLAELYGSPAVEDSVRAGERYQAVMAREEARAGPPRSARYQARLGLAGSLVEQWRLSDAIALLSATIDARPATPVWVMPTYLLRRANYRALIGDMRTAREDLARVMAEPAWSDRHKAAKGLHDWIDGLERSGDGAVFSALIAPSRLAFEQRWVEAGAAYDAVRARYPNHPQVRYRIALMRFRKGEVDGADEFTAIAQAKETPTWLKAAALLNLARVQDVTGRRADAKKTYERVVDNYEHESAAWPARVGLVTAYQKR